jgi:mycothiol synthase
MKAVELTHEYIDEFIEYCKIYGPEQDESFLPHENFKPGEYDPAFVLFENGKIIGAASLILHPEYREAKKGRFRIFHSLNKSSESYGTLLDALLKKINGIDKVYCFINENKTEVRKIWELLGLSIERYSWIFERELNDFKQAVFPEGFSLKVMREGIDEQHWCDIINICFASLAAIHTLLLISCAALKNTRVTLTMECLCCGIKISRQEPCSSKAKRMMARKLYLLKL